MEIRYRNFDLESNEKYVGSIINKYAALFPSWLRTLRVEIFDRDDEGRTNGPIAWSNADPEYGDANIGILSRWLDRPRKDQQSLVLHEILHVAQRREYNFVRNRLISPAEARNEELYEFLVEDYRERNEEFIESLTCMILGLTWDDKDAL